MDKPTDLKFCSGVKHQKMFHMCPGVFQNLNQRALDGAVKTVINMTRNFKWMNQQTRSFAEE